ncbi:DUF2637 domain-containing protein [Rhodococcus sp. 105337]|uniref:DUF2637 domain-containing protein n=1 Tax=Rhodococcus sp. 105337 TaxID=2725310 RepID=UPI00146F3CB5|nr:DUF2637 domain-containing protein [Rhodococcus sp. 105337]NME81514.1 DUF2637 domain-containing protein [Rhodococcus sp. 105337]
MTLALVTVAAMTLFIAALSFILSFDALRALAIEVGVQPGRAWMAPVAIDVAQAAATAGYVIFRISDRGRYSLAYCATLAVVTVLLSVVGNAFHAWQTAERNLARVAAGEDLGFVPQAPWIGALFAAIFPLLWLALFHLFVMMIHRNQPAAGAPAPITTVAPASALAATERDIAVHRESCAPRDGATVDGGLATVHRAVHAPLQGVPAAEPGDAPASETTTFVCNSVVEPVMMGQPARSVTRNGYAQTQEGLLRFLADSEFHETVQVVASMMIESPQLRQVDVAHRLQIDKSTVSRRWRQFCQEAETEGFLVPPLPVTETADPMNEHSII